MSVWVWLLAVGGAGVVVAVSFVAWSRAWGSTPTERLARMPGDELFSGARTLVAMTRAVTIDAPPECVWPWIAQLGRGAGWYSVDRLDNGGVGSARHIVSWIPPPSVGDASAIGYVSHVDPGHALTWWVPGTRFLGARARLAVDMRMQPEGERTRLVIRMSADATGIMARPALCIFQLIDGIMAIAQLRGIRDRASRHGGRMSDPARPETGARDQFQYYEVIYATGERAGVHDKEQALRWHRAAIADGRLEPPLRPQD